MTALQVAVSAGSVRVTDGLVANDADVRVRTTDGKTLAHPCCLAWNPGAAEILQSLIEAGVDAEETDIEGERPKHLACSLDHSDVLVMRSSDPTSNVYQLWAKSQSGASEDDQEL